MAVRASDRSPTEQERGPSVSGQAAQVQTRSSAGKARSDLVRKSVETPGHREQGWSRTIGENHAMTRNSSAPREDGTWHAGTWCPIIWEAKPSGALVERTENSGEETTFKRETEATPWVPIRMPQTTSRNAYVTGHTVLGLQHPSIGMGFNWWADLLAPQGRVAFRSDNRLFANAARLTRQVMGDTEIADLRPALANAGHPDATRKNPIWGATHVRAALEVAWETHIAMTRSRDDTKIGDTYDRRTIRVWLGAEERKRAAQLGLAMAQLEKNEPTEQWHAWLETLTG